MSYLVIDCTALRHRCKPILFYLATLGWYRSVRK